MSSCRLSVVNRIQNKHYVVFCCSRCSVSGCQRSVVLAVWYQAVVLLLFSLFGSQLSSFCCSRCLVSSCRPSVVLAVWYPAVVLLLSLLVFGSHLSVVLAVWYPAVILLLFSLFSIQLSSFCCSCFSVSCCCPSVVLAIWYPAVVLLLLSLFGIQLSSFCFFSQFSIQLSPFCCSRSSVSGCHISDDLTVQDPVVIFLLLPGYKTETMWCSS